MNFDQWQTTGQYFDYRGHKIFYQDGGADTGQTLVLLHGFPTASWDWHKVWPLLANKFRLIALDFIGFGWSDKPRDYHYSLMGQADLVEALMKELAVPKYHLLAHDYGATVAQELLARHYGRIRDKEGMLLSVVFLNGGLFPGIHYPRFIQQALASPLGFLLTPFLSKAKLRRNFSRIFGSRTQATEQEIDEFYQLIQHQNGKYIFHRLIRYMRERETHETRWRAATVRGEIPQVLINGGYDPISGLHVAEYYEEHVNQADVFLLPYTGHYPQIEAPQRVVYGLMMGLRWTDGDQEN